MPRPDDLTRLSHILMYSRKAVELVARRTSDDLESNEVLGFAVIHLLEIIGEAAGAISQGFRERYPELPWRQMLSTRNRLIHGYFDIDAELVWQTVAHELPPLIAEIERILGSR